MNLTKIALTAAAAVALLTAGTFLLPGSVRVERTAMVAASPDAVITLLASNLGYQKINPYGATSPDLTITLFGPDSGVGSGFAFDCAEGSGTRTV